jgi:hypothetical protein
VVGNDDGVVVDYAVEYDAIREGPQLAHRRTCPARRGRARRGDTRQATTSSRAQGRRARPRLPQARHVADRI